MPVLKPAAGTPTGPQSDTAAIVVAALYQFAELPDCAALQGPLQALAQAHGVRGTLLLAPEGVNGTIAGPRRGIDAVLQWLRRHPALERLEHKESAAAKQPFNRLKVRLKREIVTMGVDGLDPKASAGTYVDPQDWNALISDPDVLVVDTRTDYEVAIGSFRGACNPNTASFREFPAYADTTLAEHKQRKVAMFCTGGIRCEKSTAYLKAQGFEQVFHLRGGILKYLETVPADDSLWDGECFVFDDRVALGHGLAQGTHRLCYGCRRPVSQADLAAPEYEAGVSCPACHDSLSDTDRARRRERQRQVALARARGEQHVGRQAEP